MIRFAFVYEKFWPLKGGASIHGFHIARELTKLGHEVITFKNQADGFTKDFNKSLKGLWNGINTSDIVYFRAKLKGPINWLPLFCKFFFRKPVIVELNAPSDEAFPDKSNFYLMLRDKLLGIQLMFASQIIVVSEEMATYCCDYLNLSPNRIRVIENGGEEFERSPAPPIPQCMAYQKRVIWTGTDHTMGDLDQIQMIADALPDVGFFLAIATKNKNSTQMQSKNNIHYIYNMSREDLKNLTTNCHFGLALYRYPKEIISRVGFFGCSLKFYEYLANNLSVICSPLGHMKRSTSANVLASSDTNSMVEFIKNHTWKNENIRTWQTVAIEIQDIATNILNESRGSN